MSSGVGRALRQGWLVMLVQGLNINFFYVTGRSEDHYGGLDSYVLEGHQDFVHS